MAIELPNDLISAQQAADDAHAELLNMQERFAKPDRAEAAVPAGEWPDEQREAWDTQQQEWRRLAEAAQGAITKHAQAAHLSRYDVEAALKKAVRHREPPTTDA